MRCSGAFVSLKTSRKIKLCCIVDFWWPLIAQGCDNANARPSGGDRTETSLGRQNAPGSEAAIWRRRLSPLDVKARPRRPHIHSRITSPSFKASISSTRTCSAFCQIVPSSLFGSLFSAANMQGFPGGGPFDFSALQAALSVSGRVEGVAAGCLPGLHAHRGCDWLLSAHPQPLLPRWGHRKRVIGSLCIIQSMLGRPKRAQSCPICLDAAGPVICDAHRTPRSRRWPRRLLRTTPSRA
jgi:hypothetical protein